MTQSQKLMQLLEEVRTQNMTDKVEHLLANGVRVVETPEQYDYENCPHRTKDGKGCMLLVNMICKDALRTMPCGFFPEEELRRRDIMESTGNNVFRSVVK